MLILASESPRRRELMRLIAQDFEIITANVDERIPEGRHPREAVESIAERKAVAVALKKPKDIVIAADTVVAVSGGILGKPKGAEDAARMLRQLSGVTHTVYTGVYIFAPGVQKVFSESAKVTFLKLSESEIQEYIRTGEPLDKAGAYGIQGKGALLVSSIAGDFYTVMGLPVARLNRELIGLGLI